MRGGLLLLAALSACGRSNPSRSDAAPHDVVVDTDAAPDHDADVLDAAVDSADAPPAETTIQATITVAVDGQPRVGDRILINRRDGSFVGEGVTNASGEFATTMPDPGHGGIASTHAIHPSVKVTRVEPDGDRAVAPAELIQRTLGRGMRSSRSRSCGAR